MKEKALLKKLTIFQEVRDLEGWQAVAYAATLLERMLPNYTLFCEVTEFADPSLYRNSLDAIWDWLASPKAKINFTAQLEKVETAVPDTADFDNYGVYPALDVSMAMTAIILLIQGEDPQGAVVVSKLSQGGVEAFIEETAEGEISDAEIKVHPLMQWEIEVQKELLVLIKKHPHNASTCKLLRTFATEPGISNIGIEIN
jgi:uncharacterized protein YjaG (DUF416 family)